MRLTFLKAKNFLSFEDVDLSFGNQTIIVGPNNAGKTNLVRALRFAKDICQHSFHGKPEAFLNKYADETSCCLEIGFELDEEEKKDLGSFGLLFINALLENVNIEGEELKKLLSEEPSLDTQQKIKPYLLKNFREEAKILLSLILDLIQKGSIVISSEGDYPHVKVKFKHKNKEVYYDERLIYSSEGISFQYPLDQWFLKFIRSVYKEDTIGYLEVCAEGNTPMTDIHPDAWLDFILKNGQLNLSSIPTSKLVQSLPHEARNISKKYRLPIGDSYTSPYWLLRYMFASRMVILDEIRARPKTEFENESIEQTKQELGIYDGKGENLAIFLYRLKNSPSLAERNNYNKIMETFEQLSGQLKFDVSWQYEESKKHKLDIWIIDNGSQMHVDYVGSGILELLNILAVTTGNSNCIIILDEPALHLHPSKQKDVMKMLTINSTNNQFIIITHSPGIISPEIFSNDNSLIRFSFEGNKTKIHRFNDIVRHPKSHEHDIKKKFLQNPKYKYMPFARGVLIVEGHSEEIVFPLLLDRVGLSLEKYNIEIFNAGGHLNFEVPIMVADVLGIPYVVVCDGKAVVDNNHKSAVKNALDYKLEENDKDGISKLLSQKTDLEKIRNQIIEIIKKYNFFPFEGENFGDFLRKNFNVNSTKKETELAFMVREKLERNKITKEQIEKIDYIVELKEFIKKAIEL